MQIKEKFKFNLKKELIKGGYGILRVLILILLILFLNLNKWGIIILLSAYIFVLQVYKAQVNLYTLLKSVVYIVLIIHIVSYLIHFGFWGYVATSFFLAGVIIFRKREQYMHSIRVVETQIYGKPLDKKYWYKGEWQKWKALKKKQKSQNL